MSRIEFKMPKLGESITEAAIITWFKNVGDTIEEDEMLLEVATDKVDSEVPSTTSGTIAEILFKENDVIKIGDTIAIINTDGGTSTTVKKGSKSELNTEKKEVKRKLLQRN
jgi:2-oxoglutarate dehydrogenase E2 component (dihydrolipoamide succinyltransferase)